MANSTKGLIQQPSLDGLESVCVPSQQNEEMLPGPAVTEPLSDYHSEQPHAAVLTQSIIYTQTQARSQTPACTHTNTNTGRMHVCQHIQYMSVHMVGVHTQARTHKHKHTMLKLEGRNSSKPH